MFFLPEQLLHTPTHHYYSCSYGTTVPNLHLALAFSIHACISVSEDGEHCCLSNKLQNSIRIINICSLHVNNKAMYDHTWSSLEGHTVWLVLGIKLPQCFDQSTLCHPAVCCHLAWLWSPLTFHAILFVILLVPQGREGAGTSSRSCSVYHVFTVSGQNILTVNFMSSNARQLGTLVHCGLCRWLSLTTALAQCCVSSLWGHIVMKPSMNAQPPTAWERSTPAPSSRS